MDVIHDTWGFTNIFHAFNPLSSLAKWALLTSLCAKDCIGKSSIIEHYTSVQMQLTQ